MYAILIYIVLLTNAVNAQTPPDGVHRLIAQLKSSLPTATDPAAVHARLGLLYLRLEQADSAQAAFKQALEQNPNLAIAHTGLGRIELEMRERPKDALSYFEAAANIDTVDARSHDLLIKTHLQLNHTGRTAQKAADRAMRLFPDLASPHLLRARIHEQDLTQDAAIFYYKKYLERQPQDQDAAFDFAFTLYKAQKFQD